MRALVLGLLLLCSSAHAAPYYSNAVKGALGKKLGVAAKNVSFRSSLDARGGMIDRFTEIRSGSFTVKGRAARGNMVFTVMRTGKVRIDALTKSKPAK